MDSSDRKQGKVYDIAALESQGVFTLQILNSKAILPMRGYMMIGLVNSKNKMDGALKLEFINIVPVMKKIAEVWPRIANREELEEFVRPENEKDLWALKVTGGLYEGAYKVHVRLYGNKNGKGWGATRQGAALTVEEMDLCLQKLGSAIIKASDLSQPSLVEAAHLIAEAAAKKSSNVEEAVAKVEELMENNEHKKILGEMEDAEAMQQVHDFKRDKTLLIQYMTAAKAAQLLTTKKN